VADFLLILIRWMVAIPERATRLLHEGWSAVREHAASPDGYETSRRLVPAWAVSRSRRIGWMTYRRKGLDMEGGVESDTSWSLVPAYAGRIVGRAAHPDLTKLIFSNHFLTCTGRAAIKRATLGTRSFDLPLDGAQKAAET
jgi:hypothetical protein